ncbi:MAG: sarcosine oxidase subunit gamma [Burkholderiales bacterium]|nr:sarcosine oxidase subunit gamma [Burkholderiales bacterium]
MADATIRRSALAGLAVPLSAGSGAGITLLERHPLVMINLRGVADAAFCDAVRAACGAELPVAPNTSGTGPCGEILKLGPDEWLLVADAGAAWSEKMIIPGATLTDVSHARVAVRVKGAKTRDMLAKGCAIDLHPRQFPPGTCVQTAIAKINVILHQPQDADGFVLYAPRSFAGSFWHWLTGSAAEFGCHVIAPPGDGSMPRR